MNKVKTDAFLAAGAVAAILQAVCDLKHGTLAYAFTAHHSQLKLAEQQLQTLSEQSANLSERFSQYQKTCPTTGGSSRWQRYLTPTVVGNNLSTANEPDSVAPAMKLKQRKTRRGLGCDVALLEELITQL